MRNGGTHVTFLSSTDLWDLSPDGLLLVDPSGSIRAANRALAAMFGVGRQPDDLVGRPVEELLPDDLRSDHVDLRSGYFSQPASRAMARSRSLVARHRDGHDFPVAVSLTPLTIERELYAFAAVRDLTERRRNQISLDEANERREKAEDVERIATELHDNVVQRLFVLGLELEQLTPKIDDEVASARLSEAVDTIDDTIREIRQTISGLTSPRPPSVSLRDHVQEIVAQLEQRRGVAPSLTIEGEIDRFDGPAYGEPIRTVLDRTVDLLAPDPDHGSLAIRLDAGDDLVIVVNATGSEEPGAPLLAELHELRTTEVEADLELDHADGTTTVQWTVALVP